ncbi:MAG: hypothetical protein N3F66_03375 [Spirochaetes bacterium]|nr:hypothetical protein [Spirochaetota bacterium]
MESWMFVPGILILALGAFVVIWMFVLAIISFLGGWRNASKFHSRKNAASAYTEKYSFQSVSFSMFGNYNNCVTVYFYNDGIELKPIFLFRMFHAPLFIVWDDMRNVTRTTYLFKKGVTIKTPSVKLFIAGKSAEKIAQRFSI